MNIEFMFTHCKDWPSVWYCYRCDLRFKYWGSILFGYKDMAQVFEHYPLA